MSAPTQTIDYDHQITLIDSGYVRPHMDAIYMMVEKGRVAIIDSGTNDSVGHVLDALAAKGLGPGEVDYVVLTHVHLDHAGGAGRLMSLFPDAMLVVHPRGARHMIDPTKLMEGTKEVYGAQAAQHMYGDLVPVPAKRVIEASDGSSIDLAGRELVFYDTPGHARHHNCIFDGRFRQLFTGDMFGLSYRELDRDGQQFVFPATTPIQFDPAAFHTSINRMLALEPEYLFPTHFGRISDVKRIAADLLRLVDLHAQLARSVINIRDREARLNLLREGIREIALDEAAAQCWGADRDRILDVLSVDISLNALGLDAWLATLD